LQRFLTGVYWRRRAKKHYQPTFFSMNKQDIAEKVHGVLGTTKADAERAVETMIDSIVKALKGGDEVSIAGLGIFKTKMRAARQARNPRTGATVQVAAMRVPKFQPAKALKEAVK
jgi:DNA-binding protein HU-beta